MKKINKIIGLIGLMSILGGCLNNLESQTNTTEAQSPDTVTVQTTANQLSPLHYRSVIIDGQYQLGPSASADYTLSSTGNAFALEEGLLRISREVFPTDQYYLQEGQLIDSERLTSWVSRESDTNPEGLNPETPTNEAVIELEEQDDESVSPADDPEGLDEESGIESVTESGDIVLVDEEGNIVEDETDEAGITQVTQVESNPIYLSGIMEKNLMVETEDGFDLAGIVIGLSMNSSYQYTDSQGVVYHRDISMGEMRERGRAYANIIVGRLRSTEQLRSIPIVVGIFRQAPAEEIVGGTYIMDGISREGNAVSDWTERNEYRVSLPLLDAGLEADQYNYFNNFMDQVQNFFPNLNGIYGQALYVDDSLESLDIEIVTQFYQLTEVTALTQYVTDAAQRHFPENIGIEIKIVSNTGVEAYVGRQVGASEYQSHIFRQ